MTPYGQRELLPFEALKQIDLLKNKVELYESLLKEILYYLETAPIAEGELNSIEKLSLKIDSALCKEKI